MMVVKIVRCFERRLALKAEDLVGTWRLKSWKNVASDGSVADPLVVCR